MFMNKKILILVWSLCSWPLSGAFVDELRKVQGQLKEAQNQVNETVKTLGDAHASIVTDPKGPVVQLDGAISQVDGVIGSVQGVWDFLRPIDMADQVLSGNIGQDIAKEGLAKGIAKVGSGFSFDFAAVEKKIMQGACIGDIFDVVKFVVEKPLPTIKSSLTNLKNNFVNGSAGLDPAKDPKGVYAKLKESSTHFQNAQDRLEKMINVLSRKK
jgi:hypothetical protein